MILAYDTSNYTTSLAVFDREKGILLDKRKVLEVEKGNRGLRQSDALFQHIVNLEDFHKEISLDAYDIDAVCVSSRPRPVEGSYMPCFRAGITAAAAAASVLGVPYFEVSHQEGHIEAARLGTSCEDKERFIFFHMSGGTCEILLYDRGDISLQGGSLDISFGQIIDRTGVYFDMLFPCGKELDTLAAGSRPESRFKKIAVNDGYFNLSGLENQIRNSGISAKEAAVYLFTSITEVIRLSVSQVCENTGTDTVLLGGGVASSTFIRNALACDRRYAFGRAELSADNAVGTAVLGGKLLCR